MSGSRRLLLTCILHMLCHLVSLQTSPVTSYSHFNGGSISYSIEKNTAGKNVAHLDIITGWVLGKGPCGQTCSKKDVGRDTQTTRKEMINNYSEPLYFGNWTAEYKYKHTHHTLEKSLNSEIDAGMREIILAVSEDAKWEQALMKVDVVLEDNLFRTEDISFEGNSWHNLNLQGGSNLQWHIQTKLNPNIRSDTNQPNRSPQVLVKPFYRIKLGETARMNIATNDPDGDHVKCTMAKFVEAGDLTKGFKVPGVDISQDCIVTIDASTANNYTDDIWLAVAVMVRDYNVETIQFGTSTYIAGQFSMSATSAQFLVQVLENLNTPEFVDPTMEANHEFLLYADTSWTTTLYAEASENTTIDEFIVVGRQEEILHLSPIKQDPLNEQVRSVEVSWKPQTGNVGRHLICVRAVDNTGVDSAVDRCFSVTVIADTFNHTTTVATGKPYFVDMPDASQTVNCKIDSTCVIPIYVKSAGLGIQVTDIHVSQNFLDSATLGNITMVAHKGDIVYKADLSLKHSVHEHSKLCLIATDSKNVSSDETCIEPKILALDPCRSSPCQNSARCSRSLHDDEDYVCACLSDIYSGKNCQKQEPLCDSNPCTHGTCLESTGYYLCDCEAGWTGTECDINIDDCKGVDCNNHGVCVDQLNGHTCQCFPRYNGNECQTDLCNATALSPGSVTCPANIPGCTPGYCHSNGICHVGPACDCRLGFQTSNQCATPTGDLTHITTVVQFIPPTPPMSSRLTCYYTDMVGADPCYFSVFIKSPDASPSAVHITIGSASDDLKPGSTVGALSAATFVPGYTNLYTAEIDIQGTDASKGRRYMCLTARDSSSEAVHCVEINFVGSPLQDMTSKASVQDTHTYKFEPPTPFENSRIVCHAGHDCRMVLYTTLVSSSTCSEVLTTSQDVTIFPAVADGTRCVTDVKVSTTTSGHPKICFQSAPTDFQTRCFFIDIYATDPCGTSPCQYDGVCLHNGTTDYICMCKEHYSGLTCEKGPCSSSENICHNGGHCEADNHVPRCICKLGYGGTRCDNVTSLANQNAGTAGAKFTATVPSVVTCIKNRPCTVPLVVSGRFNPGQAPILAPGLISHGVSVGEIVTVPQSQSPGTYQVTVPFTAKQGGVQDVCLQTLNNQGINQDEICFKLDVKTDTTSLYGDKSKPHFIDPSLSANSHIRCTVDEHCHVMYHVSPGTANDKECTSVQFTKVSIQNKNLFSSCDTCTSGQDQNNNCTIDLALKPSASDEGKETFVCLRVSLMGGGVKGEERCFNVSIQSKAEFQARGSCQGLHCELGGFCSHDANNNAICHCLKGTMGSKCETVLPSAGSSTEETFKGDLSKLSGIHCELGQPCVLPIEVTGKPGVVPNVSIGYVDPALIVDKPTTQATPPGNTSYTGHLQLTPKSLGSHVFCLQIDDAGETKDERCLTVNVGDGSHVAAPVDTTRPYFLDPTLPKDSEIVCQSSTECDLDIHYTTADRFGSALPCPSLTLTDAVDGVYIFPEKKSAADCSSQVSYIPEQSLVGHTQKLCLQVSLPGKKGETRCFTIKVTTDVSRELISPCKGKSCTSNGRCIADLTSIIPTAQCICPQGFSGSNCLTAVPTTDLSGVSRGAPASTASTPHIDGSSGLPDTIQCVTGVPCTVPLVYSGDKNKPPVLGHVDPGLSVSGSTTVTLPSGKHIQQTTVTSATRGTYRLCQQTTTNGTSAGVNIDEICVSVDMGPAPTSGSGTSGITDSTFDGTSLPAGSNVTCAPSTICHIPVITNKGTSGHCQQVRQCGVGARLVHVFETVEKGGKCYTDVAQKTGPAPDTQTLCISSGPNGEERKYTVEIQNKTCFGPCQVKHCQNGGFCNATSPTSSICQCVGNFTGTECENSHCDKNQSRAYARKMVDAGKASCYCMVNGKRMDLIRKRPPVATTQLVKMAGVGAGGMAGAMLIGILIYAIVVKLKKPDMPDGGRRPPTPRTHRVHPKILNDF